MLLLALVYHQNKERERERKGENKREFSREPTGTANLTKSDLWEIKFDSGPQIESQTATRH